MAAPWLGFPSLSEVNARGAESIHEACILECFPRQSLLSSLNLFTILPVVRSELIGDEAGRLNWKVIDIRAEEEPPHWQITTCSRSAHSEFSPNHVCS